MIFKEGKGRPIINICRQQTTSSLFLSLAALAVPYDMFKTTNQHSILTFHNISQDTSQLVYSVINRKPLVSPSHSSASYLSFSSL
jgi:hypothetical protein